jgi:hypothetical protein
MNLDIPMNFWLIMLLSHAIHVYLKIETDVKTNKIALQDYYKDKWKLSGLMIGVLQSSILLIAGHDAYIKYLAKINDESSIYISFVVAFIGYGGSSLWNNIMNLIKDKLTNAHSS